MSVRSCSPPPATTRPSCSARATGGDYYDYIPFPNGHLGLVVADVSGKGVPAALIMATYRATLRTQVRNDFELFHIMEEVNRFLGQSIGCARCAASSHSIRK